MRWSGQGWHMATALNVLDPHSLSLVPVALEMRRARVGSQDPG